MQRFYVLDLLNLAVMLQPVKLECLSNDFSERGLALKGLL